MYDRPPVYMVPDESIALRSLRLESAKKQNAKSGTSLRSSIRDLDIKICPVHGSP